MAETLAEKASNAPELHERRVQAENDGHDPGPFGPAQGAEAVVVLEGDPVQILGRGVALAWQSQAGRRECPVSMTQGQGILLAGRNQPGPCLLRDRGEEAKPAGRADLRPDDQRVVDEGPQQSWTERASMPGSAGTAQTCSAASRLQPPTKIASRWKSRRSPSSRMSRLQARALSIVCWRAGPRRSTCDNGRSRPRRSIDLARGQRRNLGRGKLDGQGNPLDPPADRLDGPARLLGQLEIGPGCLGPRDEKLDRR